MHQKMNQTQQRIITLLTLRDCVTSSPATLARLLDIHRTTARYRIQVLQDEGYVTGYTPIVEPSHFGKPYLIKIQIDTRQYQFKEDLTTTIEALREFLQTGIGHAPLSVYVFKESKLQIVHCVTMTKNIEKFCDSIYHEQNIARENIEHMDLQDADGIPGYTVFSLREDEEK
ncbi:MAG: Lrp/AsnC family transcriptional regulator [Candidatus Thorarchaeota archaeon]|nr:Lrp/AsnC family transcriptional regulator [Candidatus Thorarchaeota archaeon]